MVFVLICSLSLSLPQWITHPIYQENYYNLLSANEISNLITYTPSRISSYLDSLMDTTKRQSTKYNYIMFTCTFYYLFL